MPDTTEVDRTLDLSADGESWTPRTKQSRARARRDWGEPALALLPLRAFLGITFVYAGLQKLSDPGFLHPGASTYIGTQLHAFAQGTPGGFLLRAFALPHPELAGVAVALTEIAVGLLVLLGLATRAVAGIGLALNLILFLTNSWHTYPYFLGSDIVFVFAWLTLVMAGARGQPALDNVLALRARGRTLAHASRRHRSPAGAPGPARAAAARGDYQASRRELMVRALGLTGFATLGLGGLAALAKGPYRGAKTFGMGGSAGSGSSVSSGARRGRTARSHHRGTSHHGSHRSSRSSAPHRRASERGAVPPGAVRLGPTARLGPGQGAVYHDPSDGQPDLVIRLDSGQVVAHSAVCTHAGCTVGYSGGNQIVCPCHGGTYDARTGAVLSGPPPKGLAPRRVIESGGSLYAVPS